MRRILNLPSLSEEFSLGQAILYMVIFVVMILGALAYLSRKLPRSDDEEDDEGQ